MNGTIRRTVLVLTATLAFPGLLRAASGPTSRGEAVRNCAADSSRCGEKPGGKASKAGGPAAKPHTLPGSMVSHDPLPPRIDWENAPPRSEGGSGYNPTIWEDWDGSTRRGIDWISGPRQQVKFTCWANAATAAFETAVARYGLDGRYTLKNLSRTFRTMSANQEEQTGILSVQTLISCVDHSLDFVKAGIYADGSFFTAYHNEFDPHIPQNQSYLGGASDKPLDFLTDFGLPLNGVNVTPLDVAPPPESKEIGPVAVQPPFIGPICPLDNAFKAKLIGGGKRLDWYYVLDRSSSEDRVTQWKRRLRDFGPFSVVLWDTGTPSPYQLRSGFGDGAPHDELLVGYDDDYLAKSSNGTPAPRRGAFKFKNSLVNTGFFHWISYSEMTHLLGRLNTRGFDERISPMFLAPRQPRSKSPPYYIAIKSDGRDVTSGGSCGAANAAALEIDCDNAGVCSLSGIDCDNASACAQVGTAEIFCHNYGKGPVCQYMLERGLGSFGPSVDPVSRETIYTGSITFPKENCTATLAYTPLSREAFLALSAPDVAPPADSASKAAANGGQGADVAVATEVQANSVQAAQVKGAGTQASQIKGAGVQTTKVEASLSAPRAIQRTPIGATAISPTVVAPR